MSVSLEMCIMVVTFQVFYAEKLGIKLLNHVNFCLIPVTVCLQLMHMYLCKKLL